MYILPTTNKRVLVGPPSYSTSVVATDKAVVVCIHRLVFQSSVIDARIKDLEPLASEDGSVLSNVPLLRPLTEEQRSNLFSTMKLVTYNPGDCIIRQGDKGTAFYIICQGEVWVFHCVLFLFMSLYISALPISRLISLWLHFHVAVHRNLLSFSLLLLLCVLFVCLFGWLVVPCLSLSSKRIPFLLVV